jgi:hypothetical protein
MLATDLLSFICHLSVNIVSLSITSDRHLLHQLDPALGLNELLTNPTVFQLGKQQSEHFQQSKDQTAVCTAQQLIFTGSP